jgi:hypothetical protein
MKKATLVLCSAFALQAGAALAAGSPWSGTWKIDATQSHLTGDTFTLTKGPDNMLHYSDGSTADFNFGVDGKKYKTWSNRSTTWTPAGNNAWDTVTEADGKVLAKSHRELSADGKTLTIVSTGTRPDGVAFRDEEVFARVSGTDGHQLARGGGAALRRARHEG